MRKRAGLRILAAAACAVVIGGCSFGVRPVSGVDSLADSSDGKDWTGYGRTYGEQHFSPLTQISDANVAKLGLAWSLDLPVGNSVSQPLAIDGVLYFATGSGVVNAVDAATGKQKWTYDARVYDVAGAKMQMHWGTRGIGYWKGKIYLGTLDGRLIAIDAATGKEVWSQQTTMPGDMRTITGAPRAFDGKIIIGHAGGDISDMRGYVTTYDAETGRQLWRFYLTPGNPAEGYADPAQAMAAKTWSGEWWKFGGGGNVWNAFAYDAETDTVFMGTGNGAPWNHKVRSAGKGDNLFLCSIVALDAKTGRYKWHYQANPAETWDYNASMDLHLATLPIAGEQRKVLVTAPKNGFIYVIDRLTGKLLSYGKIAEKITWASGIDMKTGRPIENPAARLPTAAPFELWPSPVGAHSVMPSAFSPATGLFYAPIIETGMTLVNSVKDTASWKRRQPGSLENGIDIVGQAANPYSNLVAWDPVAQKAVWKRRQTGMWNGGVMATAGNLLFQGRQEGAFAAYDAKTGKELWSFAAQAPVLAAPITYQVDGTQYVTVLTGMGLSAAADGSALPVAVDYRTQARRVLTFRIGGTARIPASPKFVFQPFDDPEYRPDAALAARGAALQIRCVACHGGMFISGGGAPDLRGSPVIPSAEAFSSVVKDGALVQQGMPKFDDLSEADVAALRQYIRSQAAAARDSQTARPSQN